jgi:predicted exporter
VVGAEVHSSVAQTQQLLWPTIRLGLLTSVCGFAALLWSGFTGMAQLGLFSVVGLVAAALVTRWVLPSLLPTHVKVRDLSAVGVLLQIWVRMLRRTRVVLLVLGAVMLVLVLWRFDRLWNHNLGALSPVPQAMQDVDARLRQSMGASDVRHMLVVQGADQEAVLTQCEKLLPSLDQLVQQGVLSGVEAPCRFLPSRATQIARQAALPADANQLQVSLQQALQGLPVRANTLTPFVNEVTAAKQLPLLTQQSYRGTALSTLLDVSLLNQAGQSTALIQLHPPQQGSQLGEIDTTAMRKVLAPHLNVQTVLLDLKQASNDLYRNYLQSTLTFSALGLLAIVALLALSLRSIRKVLQVLLPLLFAMLAVLLILHAIGITLNLMHVVGLLLVFAVGSNYALFFATGAGMTANNSVSPAVRNWMARNTLVSLAFANLTTVIGFGVLIASQTPVLQALGVTVAPGALLALVFSAVLSQHDTA